MAIGTLFEKITQFQKVKIIQHRWKPGEIVLYCDNMWQFDSSLEHKYHEALVTLPAACVDGLERVLICGGGDGLAVRSALQFPGCLIDLVEIDPVMIEAFKLPEFAKYNQYSLTNERVKVHVQDALQFVRHMQPATYDLVVLDFPSPGDGNYEKTYENLFAPHLLREFMKMMKPWGALSAQVGVSAEVMANWIQTALDDGHNLWQYDVAYDKASHDSMAVFSKVRLAPARALPLECRWADQERLELAFSEATEVTRKGLKYYRKFEAAEDIEVTDDRNDPEGF